MAEADAGKLDELLREIDTGSEALQEMLSKLAEEAGVLDGLDAKEIVEDEVPEPPVDPITKPGDLWILGEHRLLCGDSTKAEDVERLMAGKRAGAVVTDPPYGGILNKTNGHGKLKEAAKKYGGGDWDYRPSGELLRWIASFNHAIIWGGNYFASDLPDGRGWLVWDKKNGQSSFADAELAWTNLDQAVRMIAENVGTIGDRAHPTQKPVQVMRWAIEMTSGDLLDPFLGSGTTLIAAEQLGRKCYGMEISPQYCDVIVKRWETLTGRQAERRAGR
jgi:DNA modification methylase